MRVVKAAHALPPLADLIPLPALCPTAPRGLNTCPKYAHPCVHSALLPLLSSPTCHGKKRFTPVICHPAAPSWCFLHCRVWKKQCLTQRETYQRQEVKEGVWMRETFLPPPKNHIPYGATCLYDTYRLALAPDNSDLDKTKVKKMLRCCVVGISELMRLLHTGSQAPSCCHFHSPD